MHNHVDHRWIKTFLNKIIRIIICLTLVYTPFFAHASAAEKWTIEEISYDNVAKNIKIQAEKNFGPSANDNKYKVKVPVTASAAGSTALSMFKMGIAGVALYGLVEGVGWIIENGIVKKLDETQSPPDSSFPYIYQASNTYNGVVPKSTTLDGLRDLIENYHETKNKREYTFSKYTQPYSDLNIFSIEWTYKIGSSTYTQKSEVKKVANPAFDPNYQPKYVPVSPSEMGEEIISSPAAPQILPDIYNPNNPVSRPSPAPDLADKALENAPPIPKENPKGDTEQKPNEDTDGDGEPDVFNPEKPSVGTEFTLPEFCSWAVTVCEWYTKYKEDSDLAKEHREAEKQVWTQEEIARQEEKQQREDQKSFWQKVEDWFNWSKENDDLDTDNDPPEIQEIDIGALDTSTFKGVAGCPAPIQVPITFGTGGETEISYEPICQLADKWSFVAPLIGFLSGALILVGVGRKGEDGEI